MTVRHVGLDKQTNTCFLQVNIGAKTQCLFKEIGVGMVIPCWRRSQLSCVMRKPTMWFTNRFDTNQAVQEQKKATGWKFWIEKVEALYHLWSQNKGFDWLCSYWFSHDAVQLFRYRY